MSKWKILFILIALILVIGGVIFINSPTEEIGSNNLGHVDKVTYSYYGDSNVTIAVVSGMHSREKLHKSILPIVCSVFALTHNCKIINYQVTVTNKPNDFDKGRLNGESLVNEYVVDDLANNGGADLVIIGHDHEKGYGEDYYIATPTMDNGSVELASSVCSAIGFNHYTRDINRVSKSTSIYNVDYPILKTGPLVFVYEIPENDDSFTAFKMSYDLLEETYNQLK